MFVGEIVQSTGLVVGGSILVLLALTILNTVAIFKIITKAGYSGWWIIVPLSPLAGYAATYITLARAADSPFSSTSTAFDWTSVAGFLAVDGVLVLASWVFFLVFAFSDWPIRRRLREQRRRLELMARDGALVMQQPADPTSGPSVPVGSALLAAPVPVVSTVPSAPTETVLGPQAGVAAPLETSPRCPNCTAENRAASVFCRECGSRLTD